MQHFDTIKKYNNFLGYDKPKKDLIDVDRDVLKSISIITVNDAKSILEHTLVKPIIPLNLSESDLIKSQKEAIYSSNINTTQTH